MSKRPLCALLLSLGAGCVPDPGIAVPDFSAPGGTTDMMLAPDMVSAPDLGPASWSSSKAGTANLRAIWAADPGLVTVYVVGDGGTILRKAGGSDFAKEESGTPENLYAVIGASADDVYAVGGSGVILHRKNGTWAREGTTLSLTVALHGLGMPAAGDVYAVGDGGTIVHLVAGIWKTEDSGTNRHLRAVLGLSPQEVFVAGSQGTVLRRTNDAWAPDTATVSMTDRKNLWALAVLDGTLFTAGDFGVVLKRGAGEWTAEATVKPMMGIAADLYGLCAGGGEVVAVGARGGIQRRGAAGAWTEEKSGTTEDLSGVTGMRPSMVVGSQGTVVRTQ